MADYTINALKKAPLVNQDGANMTSAGYTAVSTDPTVVKVATATGTWFATGLTAGTATVTATRTLDGTTAIHTVEVVAAAPFNWHLGAESAA